MAHVELPDEELKPLLKSIQEAFLPLQKAMPLIMKIPEEISRVADNISQDLSSGVPGKVDGAVEKITKDEAEDSLFQLAAGKLASIVSYWYFSNEPEKEDFDKIINDIDGATGTEEEQEE